MRADSVAGVILEINRAALASAWLWMGRCSCRDEEKWAVEFADGHDRVCLALLAGNDELEPTWRNFLLNNLS